MRARLQLKQLLKPTAVKAGSMALASVKLLHL